MRRRLISKAFAAAFALGAAFVSQAHEPDGRVVIRYDWIAPAAGEGSEPKLHLHLTPVVDLTELSLRARVPSGIRMALRSADRAPTPWPDEGIRIGALAAGRSIVVELDVEKPTQGGGIVAFEITGLVEGVAIHEGVGIPVGSPGVQPKLRSGALEFPAEQGTPAP